MSLNPNTQGPRWYPEEDAELKSRKRQTPAERGWQQPSKNQVKDIKPTFSPGSAALERRVLGLTEPGERTVLGRVSTATAADKRRYAEERSIVERFYPGSKAD